MRLAHERQFITHDSTTLSYRHWPSPTSAECARALVLFHRGHEHSGRLQHVVDELALDDFAVFAWDARGHGRSPGARGDSPSFAALIADVDAFVRHISRTYQVDETNIVVIGQSVGAVLLAAWAHDYAPRVRALVLTAPAFQVRLYVPFARPGLALIQKLFGNFFITSYVKAKFLTHDAQRIRSYEEDPWITRAISARVLLGLYDTADRILADAAAIRLPLLLLISENDWVVHRAPQDAFFERIGSPIKERLLLPGFLHDTLGERDRKLALEAIRNFIERVFRQPPAADSLRQAHRVGYTHDEEERLRAPLPWWSARRWNFAVTRAAMRTLGRLSDGIRLGLDQGFDSGSSLDYVYRDQAQGVGFLGRRIDRAYLQAIGWRGVRVRRAHLVRAIAEVAQQLQTAGQPLHIADIAAGHGRYVLEAVDHLDQAPQTVVLRDLCNGNVEQGRALIADRPWAARVRFETGDAFDEVSLAALSPPPNLVVVSGLYELFSDNEAVARSLRGLARAVPSGGYLIYTGQPWHPQLELIARTLTSHRDGQPWIMRRRTQAELDELVRDAGFIKVGQTIDEWGLFTVARARRL